MTSSDSAEPTILVIDDQPDDLRDAVAVGLRGEAAFAVVHPSEVSVEDVARADLVLVDYQLDDWRDRDRLSVISVKPRSGLALATVLREWVDGETGFGPTAFALHTGHLSEARGRLTVSAASARHVLARLNNLEWVFPKVDPCRYGQMVLLARSTKRLSAAWDAADGGWSREFVWKLLGMDEEEGWFDRGWREVRECQPPIHELAGGEMLFLRWLLHQIIPYPCFLWDINWVAARLRVSVDALRRVVEGESELARDLETVRYAGALAGFLGERWWRAGIERYVWKLCDGDLRRLKGKLGERAGVELDVVNLTQPVVSVGKDLEPSGEFLAASDAVALRPDQWPPFAESPWVSIEAVRGDPVLRAMVHPLEEYRVAE